MDAAEPRFSAINRGGNDVPEAGEKAARVSRIKTELARSRVSE